MGFGKSLFVLSTLLLLATANSQTSSMQTMAEFGDFLNPMHSLNRPPFTNVNNLAEFNAVLKANKYVLVAFGPA